MTPKRHVTTISRRTVEKQIHESLRQQTLEASLEADEVPAGEDGVEILAGFLSPGHFEALARLGKVKGQLEKKAHGRPPILPEVLTAAKELYREALPWVRWLLRVEAKHPGEKLWTAVKAEWRLPGKPPNPQLRLPAPKEETPIASTSRTMAPSESRPIESGLSFTCWELASFVEGSPRKEKRVAEHLAAAFVSAKYRDVLEGPLDYTDLVRRR